MKTLKGEAFVNRVRFTGTLKTRSPLHIGTGESQSGGKILVGSQTPEAIGELGEIKKVPEVSSVIKDFHGKPLIPGSALRGVMRHWLFSVLLAGFGDEWARVRNYEDPKLTNLSQEKQIQAIKEDFSWLELLFGTPFHESKIEVWDATCTTKDLPAPDNLLGWNAKSLTYIDTSVVINPATGTAVEDLLYNAEVVPPGVEFEFNLVGQNLDDFEVGLILMSLQGFNSRIYPICVGARTGRGYGRMEFIPGCMHELKASDMKQWVAATVKSFGTDIKAERIGTETEAAGYFALPALSKDRQAELIQAAKNQIIEKAES